MKKVLFFIFFLFCSVSWALASHIYGGEMIYEYLSTNSTTKTKKYRITLKLFRDDNGGGAPLPFEVFIGVFDYGTKQHISTPNSLNYIVANLSSGPSSVNINISPCVTGDIIANYSFATYSVEVDLPDNTSGYICSYETCCRVNGLDNVLHPGVPGTGTGGAGSTYVCKIPGSNQLALSQNNSSPQFVTSLDLVCHNKPFTWDFGAFDPDPTDVLVYSFAAGYDKTTAANAGNIPPANPSANPDYPELEYINGYSDAVPLGPLATIDPNTGLIKGIAPAQGKYVVCVLIKEYRNNVLIGEHRKDFILRVQDCEVAAAQLNPVYTSCDGFSFTFKNEAGASTLIKNYFWDFGDGNTSTLESPTHTYSDAGDYPIKLVINKDQACIDSAASVLKVYPGFFPGFSFSGICVNRPTQFTDTTRTRYGVVDTWSWDFGDVSTSADTSHLKNPGYTFTSQGAKNVTFIVTSSKGCTATIPTTINIVDKPPLSVAFKDTTICQGDVLQLEAIGQGDFSWTPTANITNANTSNPSVTPPSTTTYKVQLNDNGCLNIDSVKVAVVNAVNVDAGAPITICHTDSVQLSATSDGLRFEWTPVGEINNPTILNPVVKPSKIGANTYRVTAYLGGCIPASDNVIITTVPYPTAIATANDDVICFAGSTQLNATITGNNFTWSPATSLANANTRTPTATPTTTTQYILTVSDAASGCPKSSSDSVTITVLPKINASAGRDTVVVIGQLLQFKATGGTRYLWTPTTNLTNPAIADPSARYGGEFDSIRYKVFVYNEADCFDSAYITVKIFKTTPQVFVPTAFTPNDDGKNDVIRPVAVGISKIEYFRIFNRWGQMVFNTSTIGDGWDGRIKGKQQGTNVYVWIVKAIDYTGKEFFGKGTVTLIR